MEKGRTEHLKSDGRYRGEAGNLYQKSKHAISPKAFEYVAKMRANKFAKWVDTHNVVLEFGVGSGWNLKYLACREKSGYDVCPKPQTLDTSIDFSNDIIDFYGKFDKIICHHVIEHTENPVKMLNDMKKTINDSGIIIIFVPLEQGRKYRKFTASDNDHHLFSWNVQTLGNLLDSQNFSVLEYGVLPTGLDRFAAELAVKLKLTFAGYLVLHKIARALYGKKEIYFLVRKKS
jgi:SAM-dependent methyltransferase